MAISRFYSESDKAYGLFYNFLEANKQGTFLENVTITSGEDGTEVTIAKDNATISMSKQEGDVYFLYTGSNISKKYATTGTTISNLRSALLCKNGLALGFYIVSASSSSTFKNYYNLLIFTDSIGGLAVMTTSMSSTSPSTSIEPLPNFCVYTATSTSAPAVTLTPQYSSQLTSLAPVVPVTGDNTITIPNVYVAIHTQVNGIGLQGVTIDGKNYITNGVWYVKDSD